MDPLTEKVARAMRRSWAVKCLPELQGAALDGCVEQWWQEDIGEARAAIWATVEGHKILPEGIGLDDDDCYAVPLSEIAAVMEDSNAGK